MREDNLLSQHYLFFCSLVHRENCRFHLVADPASMSACWLSCSLEELLAGRAARWQSCLLAEQLAGRAVCWQSCSLAEPLAGRAAPWKMRRLSKHCSKNPVQPFPTLALFTNAFIDLCLQPLVAVNFGKCLKNAALVGRYRNLPDSG